MSGSWSLCTSVASSTLHAACTAMNDRRGGSHTRPLSWQGTSPGSCVPTRCQSKKSSVVSFLPLTKTFTHSSVFPAVHQRRVLAGASNGSVALTTAHNKTDRLDGFEDPYHERPAERATLRMLDWAEVCSHLATFASTLIGKRACQELLVPNSQVETEKLLKQTKAIMTLEYEFSTTLDFGGISSTEAEGGIRRASKGGMCTSAHLRAVAMLVEGAERLRKQILQAAREHDVNYAGSVIAPLIAGVARVGPQPMLLREIRAAIDDEGKVMDSASEALGTCRRNVKALEARISNILKGYAGEISERGGRQCVAMPAGTKLANAILLGMAPGGGYMYMEPSSVVGLNTQLAAARGEAYSAEENVLWRLTGVLMGVLPDIEHAFEVVTWLDVLAAKARYGAWIEGVLPELTPWDRVFHERGAAADRRRAREAAAAGRGSAGTSGAAYTGDDDREVSEQGGKLLQDPDEQYTLRLRGLRHPLLQGRYLMKRASLQRQARMAPGGVAPGKGGPRARNLSTRRENVLQQLGLDRAPGTQHAPDADVMALLDGLAPPRALDMLVKPDTSVVVITGPNTGGKTAAMKALGLAALMTKAGLPVPADAPARLPCFSAVLADIGDEQSLTANLSTFSGHLARIQALRAEADGKCLILLDELGTGTDPSEGAALGLALLKRLVNGGVGSGALTLATTHHSVMTGLKFEDSRFENASAEFNEAEMAPTYRLLWGIPGRSNALNIAQRLGMDPSLVAEARMRLDSGVTDADMAIESLEELRARLEGEEAANWTVLALVKDLKARLKDQYDKNERLKKELFDARAQALEEVWLEGRERLRLIKQQRKRLRLGGATPVGAQGSPLGNEPASAQALSPGEKLTNHHSRAFTAGSDDEREAQEESDLPAPRRSVAARPTASQAQQFNVGQQRYSGTGGSSSAVRQLRPEPSYDLASALLGGDNEGDEELDNLLQLMAAEKQGPSQSQEASTGQEERQAQLLEDMLLNAGSVPQPALVAAAKQQRARKATAQPAPQLEATPVQPAAPAILSVAVKKRLTEVEAEQEKRRRAAAASAAAREAAAAAQASRAVSEAAAAEAAEQELDLIFGEWEEAEERRMRQAHEQETAWLNAQEDRLDDALSRLTAQPRVVGTATMTNNGSSSSIGSGGNGSRGSGDMIGHNRSEKAASASRSRMHSGTTRHKR